MSSNVTIRGLCAACSDAPTCMHLRRTGGGIVHCEEFNEYSPARPSFSGPPVASTRESLAPTEPPEPEGLAGLCVNCAERRTCTYPRPEGGVWHCEGYR